MEREVEGRRETDEKVDEDSLIEVASREVRCLQIDEFEKSRKQRMEVRTLCGMLKALRIHDAI